jgi:hypothetical protein
MPILVFQPTQEQAAYGLRRVGRGAVIVPAQRDWYRTCQGSHQPDVRRGGGPDRAGPL